MIAPSVAKRSTPHETPWAPHLVAAEEALARQDLRAAVRAWDEAHLAAVGSLRWDGLIEVGDVYVRIGQVRGPRDTARATARRAYFAALFRACQHDSIDGILRAAEAFAALGDRQIVEECMGLAELIADDAPGRARVAAVAQRLVEV